MIEFIDRENELQRLTAALRSERPEFIVVYGRRRLGKSTLIRRVMGGQDVYYEAGMSERATQISLLAKAAATVYDGFDKVVYPDWESIIMAFNYRCKDNATLVLDEFPYMVQKDASLPSVLQRIFDRRIVGGEGLRCNIVICGSSQRMMQKLLHASEPLYGRADVEMNLKPIRLPHWERATSLEAKRLIEEYSVWGGVPQYWNQRREYGSLHDAVRGLVLNEHGVLYNEPAKLFMDEASDVAPYSSIMTTVGSGRHRYSDIASVMGKTTADLFKPINNLVSMGFLRREVPFGENERKSKKTLYRIEDPFMAFYYRFVEPNKSVIALGRTALVEKLLTEGFPMHVAGIWERLCQTAVSGNSLFGHTWNVASRWWGKAPVYGNGRKTPSGYEELEFDVVAEDLYDKNTILIGECKWRSPDHAERILEQVRQKAGMTPLAKGKNVVYALFLRERPLTSSADCNVMLPEDVVSQLPE